MRIEPKDITLLLDAAMDRIPCDLAVRNTQYVNLFTGEIYPASVYIHQGFVIFVDKDDERPPAHAPLETADAEGRYIIPGYIDSHLHIESSMLTPRHFAAASLPGGVTSVIHDPHELTNVFGEEAVEYFVEAAADLPQRQFANIPSCVPSVPGLENAGAVIDADSVRRLAKLPGVIGLGEVMDYVGVINHSDRMMSIIEAAKESGLYLQGHLPVDDTRITAAYLIGGPRTCHESRTGQEALNKMRAGMYVDTRESSMSKNLGTVWEALKDLPVRERMTFCTDDQEADDILEIGHLDEVVRKAIRIGIDPVEAIRSASLRTAEAANLENMGAVAPGYTADFQLVDSLEEPRAHQVYTRGQRVAEERKLTEAIPHRSFPIEAINSINLPELKLGDFELRVPESLQGVAETAVSIMEFPKLDSSYARLTREVLPIKDGCIDISSHPDLCYVTVMNRYGSGAVSHGLVKGFGLKQGADASTISHDSHNLCVVYRDAESALASAEALKACGGGIAAGLNGEVLETFPLPLGGLMSLETAEETARRGQSMKRTMRKLGLVQENPLLRIATLCLIVIPEVKFSDLGLVDVRDQSLVEIFPEA